MKPPISTQLSFIGERPASRAASIPASASESLPPPVMDAYFSGSRLSMLMFTRFTPAAFRSWAYRPSRTPFVVRSTSSTPGTAATIRHSSTQPLRTSGSPPVMRTFFTPSFAAASTISVISSKDRISSCRFRQTPSGIQYRHRRLHRSVTETRR